MPKKPTQRIIIDEIEYNQIRKDKTNGKPEWWKNKPLVDKNMPASGCHYIADKSEQNHYDHYLGNKEITKEYVNAKIGGCFSYFKNGTFISPAGKIFVFTGKNGKPAFISKEAYEKNKDKYQIIFEKEGIIHYVALKKWL